MNTKSTVSMLNPLPTAAQQCPLCAQPNQCAMEIERITGLPQAPCWCTQVKFDADLLERIPAPARGKACICTTCAAPGAAAA